MSSAAMKINQIESSSSPDRSFQCEEEELSRMEQLLCHLGYDCRESSDLSALFIRAGFGAAVSSSSTATTRRSGQVSHQDDLDQDLDRFLSSWWGLAPYQLAAGVDGLGAEAAEELVTRARLFFNLASLCATTTTTTTTTATASLGGATCSPSALRSSTAAQMGKSSVRETQKSPLRERPGVICMKLNAPPPSVLSSPPPLLPSTRPPRPQNTRSVNFDSSKIGSASLMGNPTTRTTTAKNSPSTGRAGIDELVRLVEESPSAEHFAKLAAAVLEADGLYSVAVHLPSSLSRATNETEVGQASGGSSSREEASAVTDLAPKELYAHALAIDSSHGTSLVGLSKALTGTETARLLDGRMVTRLDCALEAVALFPDSHEALLALGCSLAAEPSRQVTLRDGRTLGCRDALILALQANPKSAEAYLRLATVMTRLEEIKILPNDPSPVTKRTCYARALNADPSLAAAYFGLGSLLGSRETAELGSGEVLTKQECFHRVLKLNPKHGLARSSLAACLAPGEEVQLGDGSIVSSLHKHNPRTWTAMLPPTSSASLRTQQADAPQRNEGTTAATSSVSGDSQPTAPGEAALVDRQLQVIARNDAVTKARLVQQQRSSNAAAVNAAKRSASANARDEARGHTGGMESQRTILLVPYRSASSHLRPQAQQQQHDKVKRKS